MDGDDRKGLGAQMTRALADAGISMAFLVAQTVGKKFSAVIGFLTEDDTGKASKIITSLGKPAKKK